MTLTEIIADEIIEYLKIEKCKGKLFVDITAGKVGQIVGINNRIPICINAMKIVARQYRSELIHNVPSEQSTTVEYRY